MTPTGQKRSRIPHCTLAFRSRCEYEWLLRMSLVCCCLLIKPMDEQVPRYEEDATPQDRETETEQDSQAKIPIKRTKHNSRSAWVKRIHLELNHFVKANSHLLSHYL